MSDPTTRQAAALAAVDRLIEIEREQLHVGAGLTMTLDGLEGRRRILQRHAPCLGCGPGYEHDEPQDHAAGTVWPGPDWRDAAAGLPLNQELTEESDVDNSR